MNPLLHIARTVAHNENASQEQARRYAQSLGLESMATLHTLPCELCEHPEHTVLVEEVQSLPEQWAKLPVVACTRCGHVQQNPRFERAFYDQYYAQQYRALQFGHNTPEHDFLKDQVRRGEYLYRSLHALGLERQAAWPGLSANAVLGRPPRLLDVGCSAGGLMLPFQKRGWQVYGTDPDAAYAQHGKTALGLNIEAVAAEDMRLPPAYFDLVIITGSLEHVYDINHVLQLCRAATTTEGLLLVEGRAWGYGILNGYFNHNHRRYLRADTIPGFMHKHGWQMVVSSNQPWCGPTRPGGVYVLGQATAVPVGNAGVLTAQPGADIAALRSALRNVHGAVHSTVQGEDGGAEKSAAEKIAMAVRGCA